MIQTTSPSSDAGGGPARRSQRRLAERGIDLREEGGDLVLLCVPDTAIADVAASIARGPWIAHVSGATPLAALDPHSRRFSVHPLQTSSRTRGAEQLDGAFAAVTAETDEAIADRPRELARAARPRSPSSSTTTPRALPRGRRRSRRTTSSRSTAPRRALRGRWCAAGGARPAHARTIENGFELTGPIARGDWGTVAAHVAALHDQHAQAGARLPRARRGDRTVRVASDDRRGASFRARRGDARSRARRWAPSTRATPRPPPPATSATLSSSAVRSTRRSSARRGPDRVPARRGSRPRQSPRGRGRPAFCPTASEIYPAGYRRGST